MTTTQSEELFEGATYDIEGTPELNGRKAKTIVLSFEPYELDRTELEHMELASRLEPEAEIRLALITTVAKRAWNETVDEVRVVYRLEILDVNG
jgi:hypothetical protein